MSVYRLDPIKPGDPSWANSMEKDCLWAGASSPQAARDLVAEKTRGPAAPDTKSPSKSPWQDAAVTSCSLEPTLSHIRDGTVVRADGSHVGD